MLSGRYRGAFWTACIFIFAAIFAPWLTYLALVLALIGLYLFEHAYVQAGQSVPLA
jgi:hypothetical protein